MATIVAVSLLYLNRLLPWLVLPVVEHFPYKVEGLVELTLV